jgi:hypothetical protein
MSVFIDKPSLYIEETYDKKPLILEAFNYLVYPFSFSGGWNEIRIGVECFIGDAHNYSGSPLIEMNSLYMYDDDSKIFYFGIKQHDNPDNIWFPGDGTGNNFIGYKSCNNNLIGNGFLNCCVPTVDNDYDVCATGNVAPITSNCYRMVSATSDYLSTPLDENCNQTGPTDAMYGYNNSYFVDSGNGGINYSGFEIMSRSNVNDVNGFIAMASGVSMPSGYIARNGMTISITNKGQVGQTVFVGYFNNVSGDSPNISSLRNFLVNPNGYYYTNQNYYTKNFDSISQPATIPNNFFIEWPFHNNILGITNIVIEKFA